MNQLETYSQIMKVRDTLKRFQQISWNINRFERRYPVDEISEDLFAQVLKTYRAFQEDVLAVAGEMKQNEKNGQFHNDSK